MDENKNIVAVIVIALNILLWSNPAISEINGYLSSPSVAQGSTIDLHTSTDAATYTMRVYRFNGAYTLLKEIKSLRGARYTVPDQAWLNGAQWPKALTLPIPTSWSSAIYRVQLLTEPYDPACADVADLMRVPNHPHCVTLTMTVKTPNPASQSKILVLDNATTLAAYNDWGGKSLYIAGGYAVSLLRPSTQHTAYFWDLQFAAWAANEHIPLEYASVMDLHANARLLDRYNTLVIVGHSEYWSSEMRNNLENFSKRGGNIIILGGNTMWWQIRVEGNKIVCYKNADADPLKQSSPDKVTVRWFDWPVNNPENSATGVSFRYGGYVNVYGIYMAGPGNNNGAYRVSNAQSWVFEGTGLTNGAYFGKSHTVVGYEVDGALFTLQNNRPVVSGTDGTPLNFEILAYAPAGNPTFPPDGYATMGMFQRPGRGGWVFNAATTDWAEGLWDLTTRSVVDPVVSRVTLNVMRRFNGNGNWNATRQ